MNKNIPAERDETFLWKKKRLTKVRSRVSERWIHVRRDDLFSYKQISMF